MKIAFVSYDFGEYCIQHANGLLQNGEVLLLMPNQQVEPHREMLNERVDLRTFSKPRLRDPVNQIRIIRWIMKQINSFNPDVVHFQLGHLWFNFALPLLRRRYPIVFTIHDPRQHLGDRGAKNTPQWIMDFGFRRADKVIVHGSQLKPVLVESLGIANQNIFVIPHIAIGERELIAQPEKTNTVLFFGRIWPYKGLDYLIRAQPIVNRAVPDARFLVCGKGENMERYHQLMQDPDRFDMNIRWISDDERTQFFQQASVVVLPYIEATQSGVVPIAYAHSKPVVVTRTGALPDVVEHEVTGLIVEPKNEIELANAIVRLLKDENLRRDLGKAGKRKLNTELSPEVVCRQTVDVYHSAIEERAATFSRA